MTERLVLVAIILAAMSGCPGLLFSRISMTGQWLVTVLAVASGGLGIAGVALFWQNGDSQPIHLPWHLPGAEFSVAVDGLSAIFLLPIFLISMVGSIYGLGYWKQTEHPENGRKLRLFYGLLTASMATLVIARNGVLFLFGWEIMALSAYFLVTTEDQKKEVLEAGWIYLVATHVATLVLFAVFALLRAASGSFELVPLEDSGISATMATTIFSLGLVGFGFKAGVMPLHVWLPSSHTVAPSHVSAIMSGVIIKMGIYGLFRLTSLLPTPPLEWGAIVLGLGATSGVLGVAFAIGQHDLKRLLAYHSIENIGIILLGLGLALIGRSLERADLLILGLSGGLLHVWNHALFKALLFLSAGSVAHGTHTREIDELGGLSKSMPWTALCFLVGAVAICGLPPLNGFVSEFLIYVGLFNTLGQGGQKSFAGAAFAAAALSLIGALAAACFIKVYGAVFLGVARSDHAVRAHESPPTMTTAMSVLVVCCFFIGLAPTLIAPILGQGIAAWAPNLKDPGAQIAELAPLNWITAMGLLLIATLLCGAALLRTLVRKGGVASSVTWGCGYVVPTPRMQYTSSSFAQMLVDLFGWVLSPQVHKPAHLPLFPQQASFQSDVADTVLDKAVLPTLRSGAWLLSWSRVFQQGNIQIYLLYIFIALIVLLLWR
jgi:hydrogenase-4 component B